MHLSLRSLIEVRRWVLSWGSECEVLEPEELREDIRREAQAMLERSSGTRLQRLRSVARRRPKRRETG